MELKKVKKLVCMRFLLAFNRTAYGIEKQETIVAKSGCSTFNRTAYGIEKGKRPERACFPYRTFNRTAYGIENSYAFPDAISFVLLIAPLMELKKYIPYTGYCSLTLLIAPLMELKTVIRICQFLSL